MTATAPEPTHTTPDDPPPVGEVLEAGAMPVVRYVPEDATIARMKEELAALIGDPNAARTVAGYEAVRVAIGQVVKLRTGVEKLRVKLKADSLEYGRRVDAEAKRVTGLLLEIETPLRAAKDAVDEEKQREADRIVAEAKAKQEAEEKAAREAEEAKARAAREAEEARLAAIRAELEKEKAKLAEEQAKRDAEQKRVEAEQSAERIRLEEEKRKIEAAQRAEHERLMALKREEEEKARAEREKIEADRRAVREEQERLDRIKFEQEARERAAKEAAEKAEQDRVAAENAERARLAAEAEEARRVEAARPDVEKVHLFAKTLRTLAYPDVTNEAAVALLTEVKASVGVLANRCEAFTVGRRKAGAR